MPRHAHTVCASSSMLSGRTTSQSRLAHGQARGRGRMLHGKKRAATNIPLLPSKLAFPHGLLQAQVANKLDFCFHCIALLCQPPLPTRQWDWNAWMTRPGCVNVSQVNSKSCALVAPQCIAPHCVSEFDVISEVMCYWKLSERQKL